jgi:hypothetical protein
MTNTAGNGPMLKAAGLWAKTSVKGGQYLTGRLGGVKVLILENRERQTDDDPSHILYFAEAPDRRQLAQERSGAEWHRRRARRHHSLSAAASLGIAAASLGIGITDPTTRRRCTATVRSQPEMLTSTMRWSGRNDRGRIFRHKKDRRPPAACAD